MEYAGMLLEKGVSTTKIIDETFYQKTFVQNQLLGKALLKKSTLCRWTDYYFESFRTKILKSFMHQHPTVMGSLISCELQKGVEAAIFFYIRSKNGYKSKVCVRMRKVKVSEIAKNTWRWRTYPCSRMFHEKEHLKRHSKVRS